MYANLPRASTSDVRWKKSAASLRHRAGHDTLRPCRGERGEVREGTRGPSVEQAMQGASTGRRSRPSATLVDREHSAVLRTEGNAGSRRCRRGIYPDDPRPRHPARLCSRPPAAASRPFLRLMRTSRPAVIPLATALLSPSAPCRPQALIALPALFSPDLSSPLFGGERDRPRRARPPSPLLPTAGAASPQQTSSLAAATSCLSAYPPITCVYALLHSCFSGCDLPRART